MTKVKLDTSLVGPNTNEYDRIEEANSRVLDPISKAVERCNAKLHWSYGDSNSWRVIIGIPTEAQLAEFVSSTAHAQLAQHVVQLIRGTVLINDGFKFFMELDSDERVQAQEGWFFRLKSDPKRGREFVFVWNGENLSSA